MSASMYPPVHSLPAYIPIAELPRERADQLVSTYTFLSLNEATVAQLRTAIQIRQTDVRTAAEGLPRLCDLLNRRLMEGAAETDLAVSDDDNPVRHHDFNALEQKRSTEFRRLMEDFDFEKAIDAALKRAKQAYETADEGEASHYKWASLALIERNRTLIEALAHRGIGRIEIVSFTYDIAFRDLFPRARAALASRPSGQNASIESFALEMSKPGFEFSIMSEQYE